MKYTHSIQRLFQDAILPQQAEILDQRNSEQLGMHITLAEKAATWKQDATPTHVVLQHARRGPLLNSEEPGDPSPEL